MPDLVCLAARADVVDVVPVAAVADFFFLCIATAAVVCVLEDAHLCLLLAQAKCLLVGADLYICLGLSVVAVVVLVVVV